MPLRIASFAIPLELSSDSGHEYGACGGEPVRNIGKKVVSYQKHVKIEFQIGDKITRCLLAVSTLAARGAGVWFGPKPDYKSFNA